MSRFAVFSESRGGIVRTTPAPPVEQTIIDLLDDAALDLISHWRLNEQAGATFADRNVVANMVATGSPQRLTVALVDNDISSECIALDGTTAFLQAVNPVSKPYDVTAGAMGLFVQPDTSALLKQHLLNRPGAIAGAMALEYLSGGQVRGWRYDGTGTLREALSSIGAAPAGDACLLTLSWGAAGLQLFRNGTLLGENTTTTNWAVSASLNSNVFLGRWGGSAVDFLDAVIAHAFFLGVQPTGAQLNTLSHAVSISWAESIDAGTVDINQTEAIILKTAGAHFKAPITPTIDVQGSLGTTSVNGEALSYLAGSISGFDDIFVYHFTSANGTVSQTANVTIDVLAQVEFPLTTSGTAGWFSTTHSNLGTPVHNDPIENLPNVSDGATLFTQPTLALRGTFDANTLNVDLIRSDGTQYYTKATALALPSLVIICGIIDADAGAGFRAFAGARSTVTPGGDANEDAWALNKSNSGTIRGLVAAAGGIAFADAPLVLGEKLLIVMEVTAGQLTVWRNGHQSVTQTISGARIAADGEQALLAKYYNNAIAAIMKGGLAEFYQNANQKTKAEIRAYIEYFQGEFWPSVTAPPTASLDAGDIEQGETIDFDVIAALATEGIVTTDYTLVSIHEQPGSSGVTVSVVGGLARITVAAGATLGTTSFVYCVQRATA